MIMAITRNQLSPKMEEQIGTNGNYISSAGSLDKITSDIKIVLCSVPVEGIGSKLDRGRDEGSLGISPKVAIVALVKWLENSGYTDKNWDFIDIDMMFPSDSWIRAYFKETQPDIVALSAVVSTSYSQVKRLAKIIREESPNTWIEMGGNLAASSEAVLYCTDVDICFAGDGEISFLEFVRYVERNGRTWNFQELSAIPGACYIDADSNLYFRAYGTAVNANELTLPDYKILERGLRWEPHKFSYYFRNGLQSGWFSLDERAKEPGRPPNIAGIFASKGCVARCTFCQRNTKSYRVHPYDELDSHLKFLRNEMNVGFIQLLDENFGSNRAHSHEFAKILWENNMLWMATGVRCTSVDEDDIIYYKQHGCCALKFGIESGSQTILDIMEKFFKLEDVIRSVKLCIKHGVYSPLAVMVGMPGETKQTAMETGKLIGEIAAYHGVHPKEMGYDIFYALPLPGTPLYEYGEKLGVIDATPKGTGEYLERVTDAGTYKRYYVNLNGAPDHEVVFWDVLVALEASRTFRKLSHNHSSPEADLCQQNLIKKSMELKVKSNPRFSLKYTALKFTLITYLIDRYIIGSRIVDHMPRFIAYNLIQLVNYIEFLVQSISPSNKNNNIFAMRNLSIPRISNAHADGIRNPKKRSLRAITDSMTYSNECLVEQLSDQHLKARERLVKGL